MARIRVDVVAVLVCVCASLAQDGRAQPPAADGWVVLPVDEYRALRDRATAGPPVPASTAPAATLTRVDYDLTLDGTAVTGRARLTVDVLREGWTQVAVPDGLMVRDATLDGEPLAIVAGPPPHVWLARPGRSVLTLDVVMPLATAAGAESMLVPASAAPLTQATLTLPHTGLDLAVTGGFVREQTTAPAGSRWTVVGAAHQPLRISWKRRVDDGRLSLPLRLRARVHTAIGLGEELSLVSAVVHVEAVQGTAQDVALAMPPGLVVQQVTGTTVADWDVAGGTLRIRLLDPIGADTSFTVQAESRLPGAGPVAVPLLRVPQAERETGGVAVDVIGAGEVTRHQTEGLDVSDAADAVDAATNRPPPQVAFRLRPLTGADARALQVTVARYTPQAVLVANIEEARYRVQLAEDGRTLVEARYAVRNNQRSFLMIGLPEGATVWSATVAGVSTTPGVAADGAVLLPLEKGRAGEDAPTFAVTVVYAQAVAAWPDRGAAALTLPVVDLPVSRTGLALFYSPRYRVRVEPGPFRSERDAGPFAEALRESASHAVPVTDRTATASDPLQVLIDRFAATSRDGRSRGRSTLPVPFPVVGPSLFVASELTVEGQAATLTFTVTRR